MNEIVRPLTVGCVGMFQTTCGVRAGSQARSSTIVIVERAGGVDPPGAAGGLVANEIVRSERWTCDSLKPGSARLFLIASPVQEPSAFWTSVPAGVLTALLVLRVWETIAICVPL